MICTSTDVASCLSQRLCCPLFSNTNATCLPSGEMAADTTLPEFVICSNFKAAAVRGIRARVLCSRPELLRLKYQIASPIISSPKTEAKASCDLGDLLPAYSVE